TLIKLIILNFLAIYFISITEKKINKLQLPIK
ncbi:unnamed protein product, partial [marine sediment metagenome]